MGNEKIPYTISVCTDLAAVGNKQVQVLRCAGFVDSSTLPTFEAAILQPIQQQCYNLVLDLSHVSFISGRGWGIILAAYRQAHQYRGQVVVTGLPAKLDSVFRSLGLNRFIPVSASLNDALDWFR